MRRLPGLAPLLDDYDAFLVDQFGTLHDGTAPYPGAAEALAAMRAAGRRVAVLSNSGKPAADNERRLARLGFARASYDFCLTSGEAARHLLREGAIPAARGARRGLVLERDGDGTLLADLGIAPAGAEAAELVVIAGSEADRRGLGWYRDHLEPLAARGVPALCLNPDRTMIVPTGFAPGAGRIAAEYEAMGGDVTWIGKPHPAIYRLALAALGGSAPARVAGIGDSAEHDCAGARAAGCGAWLVRTGLLEGQDDAAILAECARHGTAPDGILERFALG